MGSTLTWRVLLILVIFCWVAIPLAFKEHLICKWYNLGGLPDDTNTSRVGDGDGDPDMSFFQSSDGDDAHCLGSDSSDNECEKNILFQSDSDPEILLESDRDVLLATSSEDGAPDRPVVEPPQKKRKYASRSTETLKFLGKTVCARGHQRLYAIGSHALQKMRLGQRAYTMNDDRAVEPKHPKLAVSLSRSTGNCKWPHVLSFFWMLYMSVAEILPHKLVMPSAKGQGLDESFLTKDPDFQDRYTECFMRNIEKNYDINPATWHVWKR